MGANYLVLFANNKQGGMATLDLVNHSPPSLLTSGKYIDSKLKEFLHF